MIYAFAAIVFALVVFFLLKKNTGLSSLEGNAKYIQQGDTDAQMNYNKIKHPEGPSISMKDLLELSWKFLYDITETVLNKFSVRDQQEVIKSGRDLVELGVKYQHIVDSNPKVVESYTKKATDKNTSGIQR